MPYAEADIAGDVVLVTGATSGIGEACAWRFAEAGCKLVLTGRRAQRLDSLKASIEAKHEGVTVTCVTMDVTDLERVAALPGALLPLEVDILVNNAGLALGVAPAEANNMADVQQMMATNVTGLIAMSAAFLPGMKARGKGHLINIGSIAGHEAYAGGSGYCASKAAVTAFTLKHNPDPNSNPIPIPIPNPNPSQVTAFTTAARHDLVGTPVRVTCISPGAVNTEFSTVRLALTLTLTPTPTPSPRPNPNPDPSPEL